MPYAASIPALCAGCDRPFLATSRGLKQPMTKYCSAACRHTSKRRPTDERFWEKVRKTPSCWWWTGARQASGHGVLRADGRTQRAHRIAWTMLVGPIPDGIEVCHDCPGADNPACVNPAHLFLAPRRVHIVDTKRKRQHARGERQGASKLKAADVLSIRARHAAGERQQALAEAFGVRQGHISRIVLGREWAHLPTP